MELEYQDWARMPVSARQGTNLKITGVPKDRLVGFMADVPA
jgi:hypothetical protein